MGSKKGTDGLMPLATKGGRTAIVRASSVTSIQDDGSEGHSTVTLDNGARIIAEGSPDEVAAALGLEVMEIEG